MGLVAVLAVLKYATMNLVVELPNWLQDFVTLSLSVLIEATPFVILGILFSLAVRFLVKDSWLISKLPNNRLLRRLLISFFGIVLPVCECGNLPLARGLLMKGFSPSESITFLLSAPIMNPITITTTILAFGYNKTIVVARILGGVIIANVIGWVLNGRGEEDLITKEFQAICKHTHTSDKLGLKKISTAFMDEARQMMTPLLLGSLVAGASQILIPRSTLLSLGGSVVWSIVIMIVLAFIISICASVDAFFALSYASVFTPGSLVAFLVFGPMIDIKMLSLMRTTFTHNALIKIVCLVFLMTCILGLVVNYAF